MSDIYKLVFRGEVLDGQHPAVVRRRLGELLSLDEGRLDRLFGGQPVIVRTEADAEAASRLQALFRKAGARLRVIAVQPVEPLANAESSGSVQVSTTAAEVSEAPVIVATEIASAVNDAGPSFDPEILPVGSDVLREDEREPWRPREIATDHLALQDPAQLVIDTGPPPPPPPDTSKLRLLDP